MAWDNSKFKIQDSELITVIVPVFNADRYLRAALDSLCVQTHADFEAILVDDGSTDDSATICREYCSSDSRFRLISRDNAGVSAARNTGIDASEGEWIAFMDADDLMIPHALRTLMCAAKGSRAGIAVGNYMRGKDLRKPIYRDITLPEIYDSTEAIRIGLYQKRILNNPWGVLFHRSVFEGEEPLRFRNCRYEDLDLFYRAFERVERVCFHDEIVYFYRDTPGSFINNWSPSRLDVLDVTDRMVAYFREKNPALVRAAEDRRFSAHFNMLLTMYRFGIDNPTQKARCRRVIREQRRAELSDPDVRLKNKIGALLSYIFL